MELHKLDIYSARLIFKKGKRDQGSSVIIKIRYSKKGPTRKRNLQVPDYINTDELNWIKYRGEGISVYYRISNGQNYDYVDNRRITISTNLAQKLEELVCEVYSKNSK